MKNSTTITSTIQTTTDKYVKNTIYSFVVRKVTNTAPQEKASESPVRTFEILQCTLYN